MDSAAGAAFRVAGVSPGWAGQPNAAVEPYLPILRTVASKTHPALKTQWENRAGCGKSLLVLPVTKSI